jgi:uncharacterized phage-like protein YoqJ
MKLGITKENTCCFTGHRPAKLPWHDNEDDTRCTALKSSLFDIVEALYYADKTHFICGMAIGCDMYFCEAVLKLRSEHDDVTLEAAIPCEQQTAKWNDFYKKRYLYLIHQCDIETVLQRNYTADCMKRRNQYMVDNSSVLVAVFDGTPGGTSQTLAYAKSRGLDIIKLSPS